MPYYEYGAREVEYLSARDPILGQAIARIGPIQREITPDLFVALVESVISQQIATKAADTVCARLWAKAPGMTAQDVLRCPVEDIQACGMSMRKAQYIMNIAREVASGELDMNALRDMTEPEVVSRLIALPGIGVWTAEMMLIFSLCRPDVVSFGDLGIRRGMMRLYGLESLTKGQFLDYRAIFAPHGTVASLYLWAISRQ